MNYRSFSDLEQCVARNLSKVSADVDLIVGVPRSGLLPAAMLALHLNLPLTDVGGLIENRLLSTGFRLSNIKLQEVARARRIAVIDDSIASGAEMHRVRAKIANAGLLNRTVFMAVYARAEAIPLVDVHFEICPAPRVFAWNVMHHSLLSGACVDMDGVLCADPTDIENDDGDRYIEFLQHVRPLLRPTVEIGAIVTCRLERYRVHTERWLRASGVAYRELIMWDLPSKAVRVSLGGHADFKANVYRCRRDSTLFIESSQLQAQRIADLACKPVLCIESQTVCRPGLPSLTKGAIRNYPRWVRKGTGKILNFIREPLTRLSRV